MGLDDNEEEGINDVKIEWKPHGLTHNQLVKFIKPFIFIRANPNLNPDTKELAYKKVYPYNNLDTLEFLAKKYN
jgi:hypothetical protein